MQLKKPKLRCLRSFLEPDPFPAPIDLFVSLGDFLPLPLPLPAAFGPVLIFVFRRLLACIFSCAKPITYSPLLIISIVCPMADLWSTAPVALADAPRYVGFRPRLLCLTFLPLAFICFPLVHTCLLSSPFLAMDILPATSNGRDIGHLGTKLPLNLLT